MKTSTIGTTLVTGGAGFIGSALSHELAEISDRWVALDNLHPQVHARGNGRRACTGGGTARGRRRDSTRDMGHRARDVRPDVVVHLAAETGTAQSLDEATRHAR